MGKCIVLFGASKSHNVESILIKHQLPPEIGIRRAYDTVTLAPVNRKCGIFTASASRLDLHENKSAVELENKIDFKVTVSPVTFPDGIPRLEKIFSCKSLGFQTPLAVFKSERFPVNSGTTVRDSR